MTTGLVDDALSVDREKLKTYAIMIHKLKSPLTAIRGYAEGMHARFFTMSPDQMMHRIERIIDYVDEAYSIIQSDLEVIRGEFQGWDCHCLNRDLNPILLGIVDNLSLLYKNIRADAALMTNPSVCVDEKVLAIIMQHLVENAYQHGDRTKPILVKVEELPHLVAIRIVNWGGQMMLDSVMQNMEDPDAFHNDAAGNGLGLYIVKQYAEKMGGYLAASQVEDKDGEIRTMLTVWLRKVVGGTAAEDN